MQHKPVMGPGETFQFVAGIFQLVLWVLGGDIQLVTCLNSADVEAHDEHDEVDVGTVVWADDGGSEVEGGVHYQGIGNGGAAF